MKNSTWLIWGVIGGMIATSCTRPEQNGLIHLQLTDAPIHDEHIKGMYITIAGIEVDGQALAGWTGKQTIDILSLQNGNLLSLGTSEVAAKTHTQVRLLLDNLSDAAGNTPGCYIETADQARLPLSDAAQTFLIASDAITVLPDVENKVIIDVDVRRAVQRDGSGGYSWVPDGVLDNAVRSFNMGNVGKVFGKCPIPDHLQGRKIVLYGYMNGTFNESVETQANEYGIDFRNALVSAEIDPNTGDYTLGYVPESDLDIRIAYYTLQDGVWEWAGMLTGSGTNQAGEVVSLQAFPVAPNATNKLNIAIW